MQIGVAKVSHNKYYINAVYSVIKLLTSMEAYLSHKTSLPVLVMY